jgi:hypothetical protein
MEAAVVVTVAVPELNGEKRRGEERRDVEWWYKPRG